MNETLSPFILAGERGYIPREGFDPDARFQLSVAPHPDLSMPLLDQVPLGEAARQLTYAWQNLTMSRIYQEGFRHQESREYGGTYELYPLPAATFAPNTEQLFKKVIVPGIKKHAVDMGKKQLAVDYVSYLFPFWSREELGADVEIVEGELAKLIKEEGTLPDAIGAVYLDFPPNQQNRDIAYDFDQLVRFIRNHPSVLFIVDQANLYFSWPHDNKNDLTITSRTNPENRLTDRDLVIVTNSTTKAIGKSACAVAAGTRPARDVLTQVMEAAELPIAIGFDDDSFMTARQSLVLEIPREFGKFDLETLSAYQFRRTIARNKERLTKHLEELFGVSSISPELIVGGARIILNAESIGFENAEKLCEALYRGFSIATKPASVYASPKKAGEFGKYVHMTVPWNEEIMRVVLQAFTDIHLGGGIG